MAANIVSELEVSHCTKPAGNDNQEDPDFVKTANHFFFSLSVRSVEVCACVCESLCVNLHVRFTLAQHITVYKHLSLMQRGLKVATKQSCI